MYDQLLPVVVVVAAVIFLMMRQINKVTTNINSLTNVDNSKLYSQYAVIIQEKIRSIRLDLESSIATSSPRFSLIADKELSVAQERLSDMIRKLVFFETMMGKNKSSRETESELFNVLNDLDNFVNDSIVDGEEIAEEIKDEFFDEYEKLKNNTNITHFTQQL